MITYSVIKVFEFYVGLRQHNKYKEKSADKYVAQFFDEKEFADSQRYNAEKSQFGILVTIFNVALEFSFWFFYIYVALWQATDEMMASLGLCSE